ncbi:dihydrodipicolinate synthetase family protein [Emericellopsis cladophorae]|uniref:Dihydrodipicolinate synthetase family protein n=1 Tax=Emericellopsis cladophorae TaxID=2686198 RepID=A0A9Q0BF46_9HYPO|nr:dihydrodipicolinate synthetase family protein [Emericellopsis cladophorae]KAI6783097.1 dihydrodipicolinate synthetase family protein [Emericellopsis cladophorae]
MTASRRIETGRSSLNRGIYVPTVAFFTPEDEVDVETTISHATRLAQAGVAGLVTHGSNGEAVHLDHEERNLITKATRRALVQADKPDLPLIVGCGAQSTRETIKLCRSAAESGGTHAMILPPSYYGGLLTTELIVQHFEDVANASPIPLLIYNFPAPCGGLDLSSDTILRLARHPNIVGAKLTCGNTGKLARVVAGTRDLDFVTFGGSADFTIQTLSVGGHGVIAGTANLVPRLCLRLMQLWDDGAMAEATELQGIVARGDWAAIKGGFVSVKAALQRYYGYGGLPRLPCAVLEGKALKAQMVEFREVMELERRSLAAGS